MVGDGVFEVIPKLICALFGLGLWVMPAIIVMITAPPPPEWTPPS
jgi:hypothetical protein